MKNKYFLKLPQGYYEPESADKGWVDVVVIVENKSYPLSFYDKPRLVYTIECELTHTHPFFADQNIVVIPEVNLKNMHNAIEGMLNKNTFTIFLSDAVED